MNFFSFLKIIRNISGAVLVWRNQDVFIWDPSDDHCEWCPSPEPDPMLQTYDVNFFGSQKNLNSYWYRVLQIFTLMIFNNLGTGTG